MPLVQTVEVETGSGYDLREQTTIGVLATLSVEEAIRELRQIRGAEDRVSAYLQSLTARDLPSGNALRNVIGMVHGHNQATPASQKLPVAAVLNTSYSDGRPMAIVGASHRERPFVVRSTEQKKGADLAVVALAALNMDGYMQAISGETKATGSNPDKPGLAVIDAQLYVPTDGGNLGVDHRTALSVAAGEEEVLAMLEARGFGGFGQFAFDMLGIDRPL